MRSTPPAGRCVRFRPGLTLLELLLVVFILATLAFSAASLTNTVDEQFRFDDTKRRLQTIRQAVIGPSELQQRDRPLAGGFVADLGRLPVALVELLQQPVDVPPWMFVSEVQAPGAAGIQKINLAAGWRGPYLTGLPETGSVRAYRDGWGHPGDASTHFGWKRFEAVDTDADQQLDTLLVQSFGADSLSDAQQPPQSEYAADYPPPVSPSDPHAPPLPLVEADDHLIDLATVPIRITLINRTGARWPEASGQIELRVRVYYPIDGRFDWIQAMDWPSNEGARDAATYLSQKITLTSDDAVEPGESLEKAVTFASPQTPSKPIPWGTRSFALVQEQTGEQFQREQNDPLVTMLLPRAQAPLQLRWIVQTPSGNQSANEAEQP